MLAVADYCDGSSIGKPADRVYEERSMVSPSIFVGFNAKMNMWGAAKKSKKKKKNRPVSYWNPRKPGLGKMLLQAQVSGRVGCVCVGH